MENKDYYRVLGVDAGATTGEIKEAYRRLAFEHHPDRNTADPAAVRRMQAINEAYAVLSDPDKRQRFDLMREQYGSSAYDRFRRTYSQDDIFRGSDVGQVFEEMARAFGFRDFNTLFRDAMQQGYGSYTFNRPGVFGRIFVFGSGNRQRPGTDTSFSARLSQRGLNAVGRYVLKRLLGRADFREKGRDVYDSITVTSEQARNGARVRYVQGRGGREVVFRIPPGARDGQRLRLQGMGEAGKGTGEAGDLYLKIVIGKSLSQKVKDVVTKFLGNYLRNI